MPYGSGTDHPISLLNARNLFPIISFSYQKHNRERLKQQGKVNELYCKHRVNCHRNSGCGDTAVEEALYLANLCNKVTVVHRRDALRAEKIMQDQLMAADNIEVAWNRVLDEVLGDDSGVTGIRLKSTVDDTLEELDVHGVFIAIGHKPNTDFLKGQLDMDKSDYLMTIGKSTATSVEGVFAAGDVSDPVYRQAVTSAGEGCKAALDAERWLATQAQSL
jgi:thioredoxin reductase (NADPH)